MKKTITCDLMELTMVTRKQAVVDYIYENYFLPEIEENDSAMPNVMLELDKLSVMIGYQSDCVKVRVASKDGNGLEVLDLMFLICFLLYEMQTTVGELMNWETEHCFYRLRVDWIPELQYDTRKIQKIQTADTSVVMFGQPKKELLLMGYSERKHCIFNEKDFIKKDMIMIFRPFIEQTENQKLLELFDKELK